MDDNFVIVDNPLIKDLRNIPKLFVTHVFNQPTNITLFEFSYKYYRPLMTLSFALDYSVWKLNTLGYHLTNILIHSLNAFLVFYLLLRFFLNARLAMLTSLLFSLHPFNVQAVCYITNRTELLVTFFTLASLIFYLNYLKYRNQPYFLFSLLSFIFAMLSREAAFLGIIPFFVLFSGLKSRLSKGVAFMHFISFFGLLLIYLILRLTILVPIQMFPGSQYPIFIDIVNFLRVLMEYLRLLIFPRGLHILRTIDPLTSFNMIRMLPSILFAASLAVLLVLSIRKKRYVLVFGISWFVLTLLYMLKFMYKVEGVISVEEQWGYLASVGFCAALSYLILCIPYVALRKFIIASLIIIYSLLAFINTIHWKDEIGFYRYNLKLVKVYSEPVLRMSLANALFEHNLHEEALKEANLICSLYPRDWSGYLILGDYLYQMGESSEAEKAYEKALKIDGFCWQANSKLKQIYAQSRRVFKLKPDPGLDKQEQEIIDHIKMGEFGDALALLDKRISEKPSTTVYILAGITFAKMGANRQAETAFLEALKLEKNNKLALVNLLTLYNNAREYEKGKKIKEILEADKNAK